MAVRPREVTTLPETCESTDKPGPAKQWLSEAFEREAWSTDELMPLIHDELRPLAAVKMARERPQTLQATALAHEVWLRLGDQHFENRSHFFGAASEAMRRILIEGARRRGRQKRGGDRERQDFEETQMAAPVPDDRLLQVDEVIGALARTDPAKAEIVKLRLFQLIQQKKAREPQ